MSLSYFVLLLSFSLCQGLNLYPIKRWPGFNTNSEGEEAKGLLGNTRSLQGNAITPQFNTRASQGSPRRPQELVDWSPVVPDFLTAPPTQILRLSWPGETVHPNQTVNTAVMLERPSISWEAKEGQLYTVIIVDQGLAKDLGGRQLVHWLVINVPGTDISQGKQVIDYLPPFTMPVTKDGALDKTGTPHTYLALVFTQKDGRIVVDETQHGCTEDMVTRRIHDKKALVDKYSLDLVAGSFLHVPYSGRTTDTLACHFTRCTRGVFPPLQWPGVNDGPSCKPNTEVLDITMRGPKKNQIEAYNKAISIYNPASISSRIRDTASQGISTGVTREMRALYGIFDADPSPTDNLSTFLEGEFSAEFLMYTSLQASKLVLGPLQVLAKNFPEIVEALGALAPTTAGDFPIWRVVVATPQDQDFDLDSLLRSGGVIWMQLAEVKDQRFYSMREELYNKWIANSQYITHSYKFKVERGALEKDSPVYKDDSNTELMLYVSRTAEDQQKFVQTLLKEESFQDFFSTYRCIACTALNTVLHPSYYGPF